MPESARVKNAPRCSLCDLLLYAANVRCPRCQDSESQARELRNSATQMPSIGRDADIFAMTTDVRFQVLEALGQGGMGTVYRVWDRALDETVALKVLRDEVCQSQTGISRFKLELKLARRIHHPNVTKLYDLCVWNGHLALSQEFIPGRDLDAFIDDKPQELSQLLFFLEHLCPALQAAHDFGMVHGDFKLGNIRIDPEQLPHILDFGLASLVGDADGKPRDVLVTPHYMAPEQVSNPSGVDHRADLYSLGVVMFRLATGRLPFLGTSKELIEAHQHDAPPAPTSINPELPRNFDAVILRCLNKDPAKRFSSALQVLQHTRESLPREAQDRSHASLRATRGWRGGKVVIIASDVTARKEMSVLMRSLGLTTVEAKDADSGVEAVLSEHPAFVLMDLVMPGMSGLDALLLLKSNRATASIPTIVLTGVGEEGQARQAVQHGAAGVMQKPLTPFALRLLVERYCP